MSVENGFYIWKGKEQEEAMHPLYLDQVVQVIEGNIEVTGMCDVYPVNEALDFGDFGECVMKEDAHVTIMVDALDDKFNEFTVKTFKRGRCQIVCAKGLWGVDAETEYKAMREAKHYFAQYWDDGEYDGTLIEKWL